MWVFAVIPQQNVDATATVREELEYDVNIYKPQQAEEPDYVVRAQINNHIIENITNREIVEFYNQFTRSSVISEAIIVRALDQDVPINLAFAVAYVESRYNPRAYNNNGGRSADWGLFQLNDSYRAHWSIDEFYDIHRNAEEGIGYLSYCLDVSRGDVRMAIAAYNAGPDVIYSGDIPSRTIRHIEEILQYEDYLTMEFNREFLEWENL